MNKIIVTGILLFSGLLPIVKRLVQHIIRPLPIPWALMIMDENVRFCDIKTRVRRD